LIKVSTKVSYPSSGKELNNINAVIDHYIQICQIREKLRVDIDVITNGGSFLQLQTVKSPFQMQAVLDALLQVLAR